MSWFDWMLLAIATVVGAGIVKKSPTTSNLVIIPVVLVIWLLSYFIVGVLKLAVLMLPFVVIVCVVVWLLFGRKKRA